MAPEIKGIVTLLEVHDVKASIGFYSRTLGFEVVQSAGNGDTLGWAWLRRGDCELMLNSMFNPGEEQESPDPDRIYWHRDVTLFFGCPDVDGAYGHLLEAGVECAPPSVAPYGMKQLAFKDPDGYGICLQWTADPS